MKREKKLQNQLWKERMPLIASFFLPFFILTVICIFHDVYPFGEQCILHIDMYHQYCPFFTELMDKIKHGGSMFYSWNIGLGADFISLYAYYLASPLNWLLLLCPQNHVIEFMTLLVILKISLAGLFFGYYLKEHFEKNHAAISIFATAYALCGFSAAYAWDIMWLDCMMLAPLVVLGLEQLIKEKKVLLYYISLSLCIISNYYIAIMVCIFQVIWFVITWLENKETGIGAWIRFTIYSLLAGGTGAILIIPEAITLGASGSQNISFPDTMEWYFNIIAELGRHSVMTEPYTGKDHWPNIYCGVFVLLLFVLYLFNREISWKKKLSHGLLAAFFVISFSNNILDFIWHGMHFPDSLPGRQTFLYAFLMLAVSYEAFLHFKGTRFLDVIAAGVASVGLMAVSCHFSDGTILGESAATATYVFLPQGSIPYQQYINGDLKALPDYLKTLGYQTIATHPYNAGGWERDTVYPMLGFNESVFKDDYVNPQYVRQYISDESCVDKIIEFYENKEKDAPLFVFNVTMQNHGGYQDQYGNFTPDISVKDSTNFSLQQYLSLVKLSDSALEHLISYFEEADEKTVIVFFGDHQPSDAVASTVLAKNGMSWNHLTEEQQKLRYQVPYVVWANYDIGEETGADTSVNYLAAEVLERAGVPLDEYRSYLLHLKSEYPVISAVRTVKADGSEVRASDEKDEMDIYRKLQYYELFDHGTVN